MREATRPSKDLFETALRVALVLYLLAVAGLTITKGYARFMNHDSWIMGDWLINYAGGWVRRGLLGEILLRLASDLNVSPGFLAFLLFSLGYVGFFLFTYLVVRAKKSILPFVFLLFSPYFFAFQIHIPSGGYRKEVLFLFVLAFLVWAGYQWPEQRFKQIATGILLLYPALILSHEMLAAFLPALLGVVFLFVDFKSLTRAEIAVWSVAIVLSGIAFLKMLMLPPASPQQISQIHAALDRFGYTIDDTVNSGSILWLGKSYRQAQHHLRNLISRGKYLIKYPLVTLFALLGFWPVRHALLRIRKRLPSLLLLGITWLGTLALAVVAVDWGRLIYINLSILVFYALVLYNGEKSALPKTIWHKVFLIVALISYAIAWHIPHCCEYPWTGSFWTHLMFGS